MRTQSWRIVITIGLTALALWASWKTLRLWTMSDTDRQTLLERDPDSYKNLVQGGMRLGLDLQGGIHTVVRVKLEDIPVAAREDAVERAKEIIRNRVDPEGVFEPVIQKQGEDRIIVDLPGWKDEKRAEQLIGQTARLEFKLMETFEAASLIVDRIDSIVVATNARSAGLANAASAPEIKATPPADTKPNTSADTAGASKDVLSELLGADTGAKGADTAGEESVLADSTKPFSGLFMYSLDNDRTKTRWPAFTFASSDRKGIERILAMPEVQAAIPSDVELAMSTRDGIENNIEVSKVYFLKKEVRFLGESLENIRVSQDQFGARAVDFGLSGASAGKFGSLTGNNTDKPLAIVLDDKVESAPFINSRITRNGQITLGGSATMDDASMLATVLKAGALPAPVEIIEKNLVGPTLGSDSIRKGLTSSLIALALILLFIGVYYRVSGMIADVGLIFNLVFLLAMMAGLGSTLTMPGIAGIILTIGISVDSNILIFERIREELFAGKPVRAAIDAGYDRALVTVIDSHVTTLITAAALWIFGTGPVRGFATSLFWGVSISLLTAVVITKMIFDFRKSYKTLSI